MKKLSIEQSKCSHKMKRNVNVILSHTVCLGCVLWWGTWLVTVMVSCFVLVLSPAPPMSPWNRDALVSSQENLKLNMSMSTGLSDILEEEAGGFMSPHEAQVVMEQQGSSEQMKKLVEIFCGKRDKDFRTFLQMLRRTNNGVWADELKKKAEELKREKGVCVEGKAATQRCSAQCLQCNRGPCTWPCIA